MNIEHLILTSGYLAIFLLMVLNGIIGLPSSQFIYVTAGFLVPSGRFEFLIIVLIGTLGNTIGNVFLYEVSYRKGLGYVSKWKGFSEKNMRTLHLAFSQKGYLILFIGKFLPGIKVIVPAVAGIAQMNRLVYAIIISVTSCIWAIGLTYFGMYFGKNYNKGTFWKYSFILIILAGVAIYVFHKYIKFLSVKGMAIKK